MRKILCLALCLAALPAQAVERYKTQPTARDNAEMAQKLAVTQDFDMKAFMANPEGHHWVAFYMAAQKLFEQGKKDEAVQWYYIGQLRGRVAAALDPDPSRNGAMLEALGYGIGKPIKDYAHSDKANWVKQLDAAIAWDEAHPLSTDQRAVIGVADVAFEGKNFTKVYAMIREGLKEMRDELAKDAGPNWGTSAPQTGRRR